MPPQDSSGDRHELAVLLEPDASAFQKEQSPSVVVTNVGLVRADGLKRSEVIIPLNETIILLADILEALLQVTGNRHRIAVVEPLHPQSILLSEPRLY